MEGSTYPFDVDHVSHIVVLATDPPKYELLGLVGRARGSVDSVVSHEKTQSHRIFEKCCLNFLDALSAER